MQNIFTLQLVRVEWLSKSEHDPRTILVSEQCVEVERGDDGRFSATCPSHPRVGANSAQLAVGVNSPGTVVELVNSPTGRSGMVSVFDEPRQTYWWIERSGRNDDWVVDKKNQISYWKSQSHTTAGKLELLIRHDADELYLTIYVYPTSFGDSEFERMRQDFDGGLRFLLSDSHSPMTAPQLTEAGTHLEDQSVVRRPRSELTETTCLMPVSRVRPSAATTQELARNPTVRHVSGRGSAELFDTPDNRFACWMSDDVLMKVNNVHQILLTRAAHTLAEATEKMTSRENLETSAAKISWQHRDDYERELAELKKQIGFIEEQNRLVEKFIPRFGSASRELARIKHSWRQRKVKPSRRRPKTVVFSHDPQYLRLRAAYTNLVDAYRQNDDENLQALEEFYLSESTNIIDLASFYERWCLIRLLLILTKDYKFKFTNEEWRGELLHSLMRRLQYPRFYCSLVCEEIGRRVDLFWEKEMEVEGVDASSPGTRRPDFTLRIYLMGSATSDSHNGIAATVVLDAKSYLYPRSVSLGSAAYPWHRTLEEDIEYLAKVRNYRGAIKGDTGRNSVFILHTSENGVAPPEGLAPSYFGNAWHASSIYGGRYLLKGGTFLFRGEPWPNHRYGSVLVIPGRTSHLKRLLYLCLQYAVDVCSPVRQDAQSKWDAIVPTPLFCIECGTAMKSFVRLKTSERNDGRFTGYKYRYTCTVCAQGVTVNFCGRCKTRLYKLDAEWTYHESDPENPYNIKCPVCGHSAPKRELI